MTVERDVIETVTAILWREGCHPVRLCKAEPHSHGSNPCPSPGKRPLDAQWEQAPAYDPGLAGRWLDEGYGVGNVAAKALIGFDEDVPGGLDQFFGRAGEAIPVSLGDVVPATGKRHLWVKAPPGTNMSALPGVFGDGNGVKFGEIARNGGRQLVAPGNAWVSSDGSVQSFRDWNGEDKIATISQKVIDLLMQQAAQDLASRPAQGTEWQWTPEMGARHEMLIRESRRLAGTIRNVETLTSVLWDWGSSHDLVGVHPQSGRNIDLNEVREIARSAIQKFEEDPAPITLLVPHANAPTTPTTPTALTATQVAAFDTLYSLPYGTPPLPLVRDMFIAAEGWTVLFANGGSGKGLLALWMAHEYLLANSGAQVCVLDYEAHRWEWGARARSMGWTDDELRRVIYVNPYDSMFTKGHTLDGIAPQLAPLTKQLDIGLYVVDSFATSVKPGAELGGADSAVGFFKAGAMLGAPGLVLAHTAATTERFPSKPFGSSHIHNQARETWAQAKTDTVEMGPTKGMFGVTSTLMRVELANRKRSVGAQPMGRQGFDIEFNSLGGIDVRWNGAQGASVSQMVIDVLATATTRGMTVKALGDAIEEDTGEAVKANTLEKTVRAMYERGDLEMVGTSRPRSYILPSRAAEQE